MVNGSRRFWLVQQTCSYIIELQEFIIKIKNEASAVYKAIIPLNSCQGCWWRSTHSTAGREEAGAGSSWNVECIQTGSSWLRQSWHTEWNHRMRNSPFLVGQSPVFESYLWEPSAWRSRRCSHRRWSSHWCCSASQLNSQFGGSTWIPLWSGPSGVPGDPLFHSYRCQNWWSAVSSHSARPRAL